jgi:hypothetical protein
MPEEPSAADDYRREYQRRYREENRDRIREQKRGYARRRREADPDYRRESRRASRAANPEANREQTRRYREAHPEAVREAGRLRREAVRAAVLAHYSPDPTPQCACCRITDDLTIDHVNGGGTAHRGEVLGNPTGSYGFYRWLIRENYPPGYQVLCRPCNASKAGGTRCRLVHVSDLPLA